MQIDNAQLNMLEILIKKNRRFLVTSHIRADGDAVGSALGLGLALQTAGKDVQIVLADGIPSGFETLLGIDQICRHPKGEFDTICVLDCSDLLRVGKTLDGRRIPDLNIDHHITNENFALINIVDTKAVATAEILAEFIPSMQLPLTQPVAAALLAGIITDTIGFRTSNISAKALRVAADLEEIGVNLSELYRQTLLIHSFEAIRYWGIGLAKLERDGRMAWASLSLADGIASGYTGHDDADLINVISSIQNIDISIAFVEQPGQRIKVSWRAQPGFDVSAIAVSFGGGGHAAASGADIPGSLEEVCKVVIKSTHSLLDGGTYLERES